MVTRKETKKFLCKQLEKLHKEEHVDDLMKAGRSDELADIAIDLDFSAFFDFFDDHNEFFLELEEIPNECHYEVIFYFSCQFNWEDAQIFDDCKEIIDFFRNCEEKTAQTIAECVEDYNLRSLRLLKEI